MIPRKNLIGQVFGKLTVISYSGFTSTGHQSLWLCRCQCGNEKVITRGNLKTGDTKSCGCLHKLEDGKAAFNVLYNIYNEGAKKRNHIFSLDKDTFKLLTKQNCFYCNVPPSTKTKRRNTNGIYIYNGIDRVDNSIGYTKTNCVACCFKCNSVKGRVTADIILKSASFLKRELR